MENFYQTLGAANPENHRSQKSLDILTERLKVEAQSYSGYRKFFETDQPLEQEGFLVLRRLVRSVSHVGIAQSEIRQELSNIWSSQLLAPLNGGYQCTSIEGYIDRVISAAWNLYRDSLGDHHPVVLVSPPIRGALYQVCPDYPDKTWLNILSERLFDITGGKSKVYTAPPDSDSVNYYRSVVFAGDEFSALKGNPVEVPYTTSFMGVIAPYSPISFGKCEPLYIDLVLGGGS